MASSLPFRAQCTANSCSCSEFQARVEPFPSSIPCCVACNHNYVYHEVAINSLGSDQYPQRRGGMSNGQCRAFYSHAPNWSAPPNPICLCTANLWDHNRLELALTSAASTPSRIRSPRVHPSPHQASPALIAPYISRFSPAPADDSLPSLAPPSARQHASRSRHQSAVRHFGSQAQPISGPSSSGSGSSRVRRPRPRRPWRPSTSSQGDFRTSAADTAHAVQAYFAILPHQDAVSAHPLSGYMLPKTNWNTFCEALEAAGLIFSVSLSPSRSKSTQNREHINMTAFNHLMKMKVAISSRGSDVASKRDAETQSLFGLASVSQVKDARIQKAHMLQISPDHSADMDAWTIKRLQQRYPLAKVGYSVQDVDVNAQPTKSLFLLHPLNHDLISPLDHMPLGNKDADIYSPSELHYCYANRIFSNDILFVNPSPDCNDSCPIAPSIPLRPRPVSRRARETTARRSSGRLASGASLYTDKSEPAPTSASAPSAASSSTVLLRQESAESISYTRGNVRSRSVSSSEESLEPPRHRQRTQDEACTSSSFLDALADVVLETSTTHDVDSIVHTSIPNSPSKSSSPMPSTLPNPLSSSSTSQDDTIVAAVVMEDNQKQDNDALIIFDDWRDNAIEAISSTLGSLSPYDDDFRVSISAKTSEAAGVTLVAMIDALLHRDPSTEGAWTPPTPVLFARLPPHLVAFFHPIAFHCFSIDVSVGLGPERHTYASATSHVLSQEMFWRSHSSPKYLVPNYLSGIKSSSRSRQWETFGALFSIQLLRHALPPPRLSIWVTYALLDPTFSPPFSLVRRYEPEIANHLAVWFERPSGPICSLHLGTSSNGSLTPIDWLIGEVFGNQTLKNLPLSDLSVVDKALLCHFFFDDKDFLNHPEHQAFMSGWNVGNKLITATQGLSRSLFEALYRNPSLTGEELLKHVQISISAPKNRMAMYHGVAAVFFKRLQLYLCGAGHPPSSAPLIGGLDPPLGEELALSESELRPYYLLKAVSDYRTIPAQSEFTLEIVLREYCSDDDVECFTSIGVPSIATCGQQATFFLDQAFIANVIMAPQESTHRFENWIHLVLATAVRTRGYNKV